MHETAFLDDLDLPAARIERTEAVRQQYATDYGTTEAEGSRPDVVVTPTSTEEVAAVLAAANDHGVPVTPYAAGTSTEGHSIPTEGGVSLDLTDLDRIVEIRPDDRQVDVQAGVIGEAINDAARQYGLFLPPLPSSADMSTIGGMIANDASGMKTVKYGEVREWVNALEVVLADGTVIETGSRAPKTSSGYNLTELIIGSEGTLGVVTQATFSLAGLPEHMWSGRATFPSTEEAAAAVTDAISSGVDLATVEVMDPLSLRIADSYIDTGLEERPAVLFEIHANHGIEEELEFCRSIFEAHGATTFETTADSSAYADLWESRRQIGHAITAYDPDLVMLTVGDVAVPIGAYPEMMAFARGVGEELDLLIPCFGHAGDGNIHYTILVDPEDDAHVARGWDASDRIVRQAIDLGGTATGEHGIGESKRRYMVDEHGQDAIEVMRAIKTTLDPNGILNPGKIFPDEDAREPHPDAE